MTQMNSLLEQNSSFTGYNPAGFTTLIMYMLPFLFIVILTFDYYCLDSLKISVIINILDKVLEVNVECFHF